ncbi:hypothetical protein AYO42_03180 [Rhizomicrobium sp. SCGC AG-212-E05]|nr:hypothetical protein AYO42_03180 [Rhizomicrobium sp. SCGC AG-212-E05]
MRYRPEIDGLRAVAIVPVLLFHAGFPMAPGGFVGVDVFFVISGYLITSIINAEMAAGRFSLTSFYERRMRRILPALFLVMAAVIPAGWIWLMPKDLSDLGESLIAVPVFASNFLFMQTTGYFDRAGDFKPLLHTWSLGVEEQYYILFPLFLMILRRWAWRWRWCIIPALTVASLGLAEYAVHHRPDYAFYLLPFRGWELLLGSLIAVHVAERAAAPESAVRNGLAAAGAAMIVAAVALFDRQTPSPGVWLLVPAVGAALVIAFGDTQGLAGKILGSAPIRGIGLISYSAYLWHQPLFAFARHRSEQPPSTVTFVILIIATLALAAASWWLVERPFRDRCNFTRPQLFVSTLCGCLAFMAVGAVAIAADGFPNRFRPDQQKLLADMSQNYRQTMNVFGLRKCFIDYDQTFADLIAQRCVTFSSKAANVIVYGDSQAADLMSGVHRAYPAPAYAVSQWTATGCRSIDYPENDQRCRDFVRAFEREIIPVLSASNIVIVSSNWKDAFESAGQDTFSKMLGALLTRLKSTGARVVVLGQTPGYEKDPLETIVRAGLPTDGDVYLKAQDARETDRAVRDMAKRHAIPFVDIRRLLCRHDGTCLALSNGAPVYFDNGHFSVKGSEMVGQAIAKAGK